MRAIIFLLSLSASLSAAEARWPKNASELKLTVHFHEALEEGPILAELTLENLTNETLKISRGDLYSSVELDVAWRQRECGTLRAVAEVGSFIERSEYEELAPDEMLRVHRAIHSSYLQSSVGRVSYKASWSICEERPHETLGRWPVQLFALVERGEVDILPATPTNVTTMLQRYQAYRAKPEGPRKSISSCRHLALVPALLQELTTIPATKNVSVGDVYECCPTPAEAFAKLLAFLEEHPEVGPEVFAFWHEQQGDYAEREQQHLLACSRNVGAAMRQQIRRFSHRDRRLDELDFRFRCEYDPFNSSRHPDMRCTEADFERLLTLKNPALRCLLYASFSERCSAGWTAQLQADLHAVGKPTETFATLLAQLDHPRFAMREAATVKLCEWAPAFAKELEAAVGANADVQQRLEKVRAALVTNKPPLYWQCVLFALKNNPRHGHPLLETISAGPTPSYLRHAAKMSLIRIPAAK